MWRVKGADMCITNVLMPKGSTVVYVPHTLTRWMLCGPVYCRSLYPK